MSLSIASYRQAGDLIEDADVDENANIAISKLATRTLYYSTPAQSTIKTGAGVVDAFNGAYGGIVMPDANASSLFISLPLPDEWVSGTPITARVWWITSVTAGNALFAGNLKSATEDGATAVEEVQTVVGAAAGTANLLRGSTMTFLAADFTAGDIIGLKVDRTPADASDTLAADLTVLAIDIEITGRG